MKCPMKFNQYDEWQQVRKNGKWCLVHTATFDCEKEKCEWWDKEGKCCVIKHLRHIDCLVDAICLLYNKKPKEDL